MSPITRVVAAGLQHGMITSMTANTDRLKEMRREAESSDYLMEAWSEILSDLTGTTRESKCSPVESAQLWECVSEYR